MDTFFCVIYYISVCQCLCLGFYLKGNTCILKTWIGNIENFMLKIVIWILKYCQSCVTLGSPLGYCAGLVQDCSNSIANALVPLICAIMCVVYSREECVLYALGQRFRALQCLVYAFWQQFRMLQCLWYGSSYGSATVLLPGFAIKW